MAKILIALKEAEYQKILREWLKDRHTCFIVQPRDLHVLRSKILNMDYDLGFIDETVLNNHRDDIKERKLKEYPIILPFIYIKSSSPDEDISELWAVVDEILRLPLKKLDLYMRTQRLLNYRRITLTLHYISVTDPVSGFFNYKYLMIIGEQEFEQAKRYKRPLSIMLMYIDQFSKIKLSYPASIVDSLVRHVAQRCYLKIRSADIAGRYGFDKFLFIMPETSAQHARITAERLRKLIYEKPVIVNGRYIYVTASFGVVELDEKTKDFTSFVDKAETALSIAKEKGGNRVELYVNNEETGRT